MTEDMKRLSLVIFAFTALSCVASAGVELSLYSLSVEEFKEIEGKFLGAVADGAITYCEDEDNECPETFRSGNLSANLVSEAEKSKMNVNVTVIIKNSNDDTLSKVQTKKMIDNQRQAIYEQSGEQIESAEDTFYGINPDDPTNWIMIAIFSIFTLVLLLVVLYLSKHKVDHAEEHYEQMKVKTDGDGSADGEVAA